MNNRISLKLIPDSSFLLGGVSADPAYDSITALDDNLPFLTATAIKGAIRMEFEAFVRGIGELTLCELDTDFRGCGKDECISCKLFGGGDKEGKLRFNSAFIKDRENLFPEKDKKVRKDILEKGRREGVSISRTLGKAKEQSYYSAIAFPNMKDVLTLLFETHIDIQERLEDNEYKYLDMFFSFLDRTGIFMGSRKSVGLGNFKIEYDIPSHFEPTAPIDTTKKELKLFRVKLKTHEPLVVGNLKNQYIIDTLPYIPASTMGGSIGFGFIKNGIPEDIVRELFIDKNTFSPFNFYLETPYPKPTSMRRKKGDEKTVQDTLLVDYIVKRAIDKGKFQEVEKLFKILYRENLRPVPICEQPATYYNTKVAIGRSLQKTKEQMLYRMELIEKGTVFQGLVIGEAWTKEALEKIKFLFIGGKRTRGFGRTEILKVEEVGKDELLNPNPDISIDTQLRTIAREYSIDIPKDRSFFALDLLADIGIGNGIPKGERTFEFFLEKQLFNGIELEVKKSFPVIIWRGGYGGVNTEEKMEKPLMEKISAGSTFLVSVPFTREKDFKEKVAQLIEESIHYKWDSTPLFRLNNPDHLEIWR
ncbi:MAG: RAMP superfamily CRISPR-associated protein [Candidatus Aminicenantes bacterium]|jgi:CRISPR/Cas system CSM-associated protein Csm3 (group 7 of RAMP superfamily)